MTTQPRSNNRLTLAGPDDRIRELVFGADDMKEWLQNMIKEVDKGNISEVKRQLQEALRKI